MALPSLPLGSPRGTFCAMTESDWKAREDAFLTKFKEGQGTIVPLSKTYHPPLSRGKGRADRRRQEERREVTR